MVIKRKTTFQNGITAGSPAWKKLEAVPETESYSLQANVDDGELYMLQENITFQSHLQDRMLPEDEIAKLEVQNGICTAYNPQGGCDKQPEHGRRNGPSVGGWHCRAVHQQCTC